MLSCQNNFWCRGLHLETLVSFLYFLAQIGGNAPNQLNYSGKLSTWNISRRWWYNCQQEQKLWSEGPVWKHFSFYNQIWWVKSEHLQHYGCLVDVGFRCCLPFDHMDGVDRLTMLVFHVSVVFAFTSENYFVVIL